MYHFEELDQADQEDLDVRLVRSFGQVVEDHMEDLLLVLKRRSGQNQQLCQLPWSQEPENLELHRVEATKQNSAETVLASTLRTKSFTVGGTYRPELRVEVQQLSDGQQPGENTEVLLQPLGAAVGDTGGTWENS